MATIGIVGAGIAALHLGLALRAADAGVTLYTEKSAADVAGGPLLNTVAHHHRLLARERELGVHHWDAGEYGYGVHHYRMPDATFTGRFAAPSCAIDHRLYLPRLMADFEERGGRVEIRRTGPRELGDLAAKHDLLVVASGRGALSGLFPRRAAYSPHDAPRRTIFAGLFTGVRPSEPRGVSMSVAPGRGELLEIPLLSRDGAVTALLFESPGEPQVSIVDNLRDNVLKALTHHPGTLDRVDEDAFGLTDPRDVLTGGVTPAVREDWLHLGEDRYALALGDAHVVVDPLLGQGANLAAYSAAVVAEEILRETVYDELFCRRVARAREEVLLSASDWTNLMLDPPSHVDTLFPALATDPALADEFTDNYAHPERQWRLLATPRRLERFLTSGGERS